MPDLLVPYQGGEVRISPEAQVAAKAAQEWAEADKALTSVLTQPAKRGVQELDQESMNAKQEVMRQMRMNPPKPATVINLHPWPLTFGSGVRLLRGITIPACEPGMPYAHYHIRGYRLDWEQNENGTLKFRPILPLQMAAEFVREFSNKDSYVCGVIIYEGDGHPDKVNEVETFDQDGKMLTTQEKGYEYDQENQRIATMVETPIRRKLADIIAEHTKRRNAAYLERVRRADHDYKLPDGKGKWLINDTHLLMAQVLFEERQLQKLPEWNLASRFEAGLSENNCPACGGTPRDGAFKCTCGHILNAFEAYKAGAIQWGHASMETMSSDQLDEAEEIRAEREAVTKRLSQPVEDKPKGKKAKE